MRSTTGAVAVLILAALPASGRSRSSTCIAAGRRTRDAHELEGRWGWRAGDRRGKPSPISLSAAPAFDYMKQENGGSAQETVALDLAVQPAERPGQALRWRERGSKLEQRKREAAGRHEARQRQEHVLTTRFRVLISMQVARSALRSPQRPSQRA